MAPRRYDLLAIDLDGTLLCPKGAVSAANIEAIYAARRAGMNVTVCTGRGLMECRHLIRRFEQRDPVVVAGGSMLACPVTGRTLHKFPMDGSVVRRLVDLLAAHGHAVLVLKDPHAAGYDYVVVSERGEPALDPVTRWWFRQMQLPVRYVRSLDEDEHPGHTVRVGVCGPKRRTDGVAEMVRRTFAHEAAMQHFHAVVPRDEGDDPEGKTLILEVFAPAVDKWAAIEWLAGREGIAVERIAAIGNDINDVAMLRQAACGVAMANAIPEAKAVADRHTLGNDADGVAHAIGRILSGEW
jgi:hydroxymethylpyrimidine pyrophosphatase-like HAD family hydrolase